MWEFLGFPPKIGVLSQIREHIIIDLLLKSFFLEDSYISVNLYL